MTAAPLAGPTAPPYDFAHGRWALRTALAALVIIPAVVIVAVVVAAVVAGVVAGWGTFPLWTGGAPWFVDLIVLVVGLVVVVTIVRVVVAGVLGPGYYYPTDPDRWVRRAYRHAHVGGPWGIDPAVDLARDRYARGEISRDEFARILRDLGSGSLPP